MTAASEVHRDRTPRSLRQKVPQATALFWVIKVLTTGMGECISDSLIEIFGYVIAIVGVVALAVALWWQFRQDRYRTWPYWTAVAMVSIVGTMVADGLRKGLSLSYVTTTITFSLMVAASLTIWWLSERTLSIHSITTRRREIFYWCTVMSTFALGTAVGDMTASTLHWGFLQSGLLFCVLIVLPALAYRFLGLNAVTAFWASYVITRPLGASFADWAWIPASAGGLALGRNTVSLITFAVFVVAVLFAARTRNGAPGDALATG